MSVGCISPRHGKMSHVASLLDHVGAMPKWASPYLSGWDDPGSNFSSLARGTCPDPTQPSQVCPRCEERARAGVCPPPGTLADLLENFPRVNVLCLEADCARHTGGYWPSAIKQRMRALDVRTINTEVSRVAGHSLATAFGMAGTAAGSQTLPTAADEAFTEPKRRTLALLSHLHAVHLAVQEGLESVVVMESDLKPLVANSLKMEEVWWQAHHIHAQRLI